MSFIAGLLGYVFEFLRFAFKLIFSGEGTGKSRFQSPSGAPGLRDVDSICAVHASS